MYAAVVLLLGVAAVTAIPPEFQAGRIVGGSVTTINEYPFGAAMLSSLFGSNHRQSCGGTVINNRSILTAAHCFLILPFNAQWRIRLGSTNANSGGVVYTPQEIVNHHQYSLFTNDNDFSIVRVVGNIAHTDVIRPASVAGPNYNVADNQVVWAIGWGVTSVGGSPSEQLRHVQIWTINHNLCTQRYAARGLTVTPNMLCSGWLDVGGRDQCQGDSGSPLLHNGVVVGVCSWGRQCALPHYPGVNARVSSGSQWIQDNA